MVKNFLIIFAAVLVIALPFIFRKEKPVGEWKDGDPVLVAISPHIASIRDEFALGFSNWHFEKYGKPVKIDWRSIGGTTEIMRYINGEYTAAYKAYRLRNKLSYVDGVNVTDKRKPKDDAAKAELWEDFRAHDNPQDYGIKIDVFFGGGTYDHSSAARQGFTIVPWTAETMPKGLIENEEGTSIFPEGLSGEDWRNEYFYSAVLSGFGICYNPDRLKEMGVENPPAEWRDLRDLAYFGQLALADPTKSGSVAKTFEMIIHTECRNVVYEAGWTDEQIDEFEAKIAAAKLPNGVMPEGVPQKYQEDVERGWKSGLDLIRQMGMNVRYFTDASGKVPVDVAAGDAALGISIDFYSRVQAEVTRDKLTGADRLIFVNPKGGSSISGDPISILRGAENKELALRFMEYVLSEDGQKLWNYKPGTPGGPVSSALRRLPVRRDFYPSADNATINAKALEHSKYTSDNLLDPKVDAYSLANDFMYRFRWTGRHFSFFRQFIRAMCMDSGVELRAATKAIIEAGGPEKCPQAMEALMRMPSEPYEMSWTASLENSDLDSMECMREWTIFFRNTYKEAERLAKEGK